MRAAAVVCCEAMAAPLLPPGLTNCCGASVTTLWRNVPSYSWPLTVLHVLHVLRVTPIVAVRVRLVLRVTARVGGRMHHCVTCYVLHHHFSVCCVHHTSRYTTIFSVRCAHHTSQAMPRSPAPVMSRLDLRFLVFLSL